MPLVTFALLLATARPPAAPAKCMAFVSRQLERGRGNFFTYLSFSTRRLEIRPGDVLEYEVWLDPANPEPKGGVDVEMDGTDPLRDHHVPDQNGIDCHGDGLLVPAVGKWYARRISLDAVAGHEATSWDLAFEGDAPGRYAQFVDAVEVLHADGTKDDIFPAGRVPSPQLVSRDGYTKNPAFGLVDRADVGATPVAQLVAAVEQRAGRFRAVGDAQANVDLIRGLAPADAKAAIDAAQTAVGAASDAIDAPDATFDARLAAVDAALAKSAKFAKSFVADAVGHAHIDVQWLWESQESLQAAGDTWRQAVAFMNQYPDFCFSQSSAGYYRQVQYTWPALFKAIQAKVKSGQWEIVGGRECEADENLISPEAHARQFLYAQRYFRKEFGRTATVGWEPDTFGHTAQTPQIMSLGGCDSFYFCRGGKGDPVFNWKGLDGTTILAYDSQAAGSWYNMGFDKDTFRQIPPYREKTKQNEMMWVYGVGDHGGGPTKEEIEQVKAWQKAPGAPTVRFSTAAKFFGDLAAHKSELPTVDGELEGVFLGCYTTNAGEKRLNRFAEAEMTTAEAISSVANYLGGLPYPRAEFAKDWEKITFNQHHDTMCGSSFHWAYLQTVPDLKQVIADAKDAERDALVNLSVQVTPTKDGQNFLVFNPTGWARDGWADVRTPDRVVDGKQAERLSDPVAVGPDGVEHPIELLDPVTHAARFYATAVPAFGYRVYTIKQGSAKFASTKASADGVLENDDLRATFDLKRGCISSLVDKATGKEYAGPGGLGALESHLEKPAIEAWDLGDIVGVKPFAADSVQAINKPGYSALRFTYRVPDHPDTPVTQTFRLEAGSKQVDVNFDVDWQVVSDGVSPSPLVRLAFDSGASEPKALYEIPFGAVSRPVDGAEVPAQAWADVSGPDGGVTVLEDCKHGFSCTGPVLRMSVIRGNTSPDVLPNRGEQPLRYAIVPHAGACQVAAMSRKAAELESGLLSVSIPVDCKGTSPLEFSFASVSDDDLVPTCLKKAEDGGAFVVRMFDAADQPSRATLAAAPEMTWAKLVNFVEDPIGKATPSGRSLSLTFRPWQIETVEFAAPKSKD